MNLFLKKNGKIMPAYHLSYSDPITIRNGWNTIYLSNVPFKHFNKLFHVLIKHPWFPSLFPVLPSSCKNTLLNCTTFTGLRFLNPVHLPLHLPITSHTHLHHPSYPAHQHSPNCGPSSITLSSVIFSISKWAYNSMLLAGQPSSIFHPPLPYYNTALTIAD